MKIIHHSYDELKNIHDTRAVLERAVKLFPDRLAYQQFESKTEERGLSFKGLYDGVNAIGTVLLRMGMEGKHIALLGETSIAWITSMIAISNGVGVVVPIDKELPPETIAYQLEHSDSDMLFVSANQLKKLPKILAFMKEPPQIVVMRSHLLTGKDKDHSYMTFEQMLREGKIAMITDECYKAKKPDPDQFCLLVYTSGTTGANKGVMLCQRNIWADGYGCRQICKYEKTSLSVLPANHTFELSADIHFSLYEGTTVYINDDLRHVLQNLNHFKPEMMVVVPAMLELIAKRIKTEAEKDNLGKHMAWAIRWSNFIRKLGIDERRKYFAPIHKKLGGNLKMVISGGAPLSDEVNKFLNDIGIEVLNGYGITECSPVLAVNRRGHLVAGSVGQLLPGCTARIADPDETGCGEIQVKGDNVMLGYYKLPEDTAAVFTEDGWFRTGDIGHLDKDNNIFLTGRLKNLIILDNGKNIAPEELEELLIRQAPEIKEVVVYAAEDSSAIMAAIYMDPEACKELGLDTVEKQYDYALEKVMAFNKSEPSYKRISDIKISEHEFIKTTTMKIKRALVEK